jgi:5-methylcytosine-specific restriction endonuclease McrA
MNKKIDIIGTSHRYQMNKVNKIQKPKTILKPILEEKINSQLLLLTEQKDQLNNISPFLSKQIKKKLSSYKSQDICKNRINSIIQYDDLINKMKQEELKCHYCKEDMYILYEFSREHKQWTLDRINNDLGHSADNVVLSCLDCNLKKRKKREDAYLFTKNLIITKTIDNYN